MKKYLITIIKFEDNENYERELAEWKEANKYGILYHNGENKIANRPEQTVASRSLETVLTEDEFKVLKKEIFKEFE